MGKKKKTLEQKKMAELRRRKEFSSLQSAADQTPAAQSFSLFSYSFTKSNNVSSAAISSLYSLQHDLRKTVFVSLGILLALLLLSALLKTHAIVLPLVSIRY